VGPVLRRRLDDWTLARVLVPLACLVPFADAVARGSVFYIRDLSSYFFPIRRFVVEGLRHGEIRHWNPYVNEGAPVLLPPVGYPVDLLQVLLPSESGFSLLLALHVPLAAFAFLALARRLGLQPAAAALGALAYALSGFALASLNLYVHLEAVAWAPLVIGTLLRAASGGPREIALAAAATGVCLSTTGVEIAAQAVGCAFLLSLSRRADALLRFGASVLLGAGIAASPLVALLGQVSGSQRDAGFRISESLAHSVHPAEALQVLFASIFGDPMSGGDAYWGGRFSNGVFPYFTSLYLGGAVLSFAAVGALGKRPQRTRLLLLLALGLAVALGRWAHLDLLMGLAPVLAKFRFPVKAFFTVMLSIALLASFGAESLLGSRRPFRQLLLVAAPLGVGLLAFAGSLPRGVGERLFVDAYPQILRPAALGAMAADAAQGAAVVLALAALAWLGWRERISARAAVVAAAALVAADLVRAGAGLNPTAPSSFYELSPEMTVVTERLRHAGGRVFTCLVQAMPTFQQALQDGRSALWSAAVSWETLSPYANVAAAIDTTGADPTALVAGRLSMTSGQVSCRDPGTLERLRAGGVRYILSVQPFANEALRLVDVASPARTAPLSIYVYELAGSPPDPAVSESPDDLDASGYARTLQGASARYLEQRPGAVHVAVETPRAAWLILRHTSAAGWTATVNGKARAVSPANGRHQALAVPQGTSEVTLSYRAPHAALGFTISIASLAVAAGVALRSAAAGHDHAVS
jgi:hypothetical protein